MTLDLDSELGERQESGPTGARPIPRDRGRRSAKNASHRWTRIVHVYLSMISMLVVLFFALTGLTLNHQEWSFGMHGSRSTVTGTLPAGWNAGGSVDWLKVSDYLRAKHDVRGSVVDKRADETQGSISYAGPGYSANAVIDVTAGTYRMTLDRQGLVAVMNDLHKGRDTTRSWRWLIDVSAIALTVISATGLALQFFLRKRRRSALSTATVGALLLAALYWVATR